MFLTAASVLGMEIMKVVDRQKIKCFLQPCRWIIHPLREPDAASNLPKMIRSKEKERRPHLETLEAKVENNDSQGGKDANGASIVGVHSPLHPTHLHLLFLNQHLKESAVKDTRNYGVQDLPLNRCVWF